MKRTLAAFALLLTISLPAHAAYRIVLDPGGVIEEYHKRWTMLRDAGAKIEIDGHCLSACTMLLGLIPNERVCVTERARLGFHSASQMLGIHSSEGTRFLWSIYSEKVREMLRQKSWDGDDRTKNEHQDFIYVEGRELEQFFQRC